MLRYTKTFCCEKCKTACRHAPIFEFGKWPHFPSSRKCSTKQRRKSKRRCLRGSARKRAAFRPWTQTASWQRGRITFRNATGSRRTLVRRKKSKLSEVLLRLEVLVYSWALTRSGNTSSRRGCKRWSECQFWMSFPNLNYDPRHSYPSRSLLISLHLDFYHSNTLCNTQSCCVLVCCESFFHSTQICSRTNRNF